MTFILRSFLFQILSDCEFLVFIAHLSRTCAGVCVSECPSVYPFTFSLFLCVCEYSSIMMLIVTRRENSCQHCGAFFCFYRNMSGHGHT